MASEKRKSIGQKTQEDVERKSNMNEEQQIAERNQLADLLADIGHDWDNYLDACQENEIELCFTYEDFHADSLLDAGYRKASDIAAEIFAEVRQLLERSTIIKSSDFSQPYFDMFYFKKCLINLEKKYNESDGEE